MSQLEYIHPYPAMIAKDLAQELVNQYVKKGEKVLDPFCGSGRIVYPASKLANTTIGLDVNPLACLISRAKGCTVTTNRYRFILESIHSFNRNYNYHAYDIEPDRKVKWFSDSCKREICEIISWINYSDFSPSELQLISTIFSATVRESSFCRKDQWKLHRISKEKRRKLVRHPWEILLKRLESIKNDITISRDYSNDYKIIHGDARKLSILMESMGFNDGFNAVITSPPYGDSRTTVQYGGIASLCLGALKHIEKLDIKYMTGQEIDKSCLGDPFRNEKICEHNYLKIKKYWNGSKTNTGVNRILSFTHDLSKCTNEICKIIKKDGFVIFIVSRRSVGGWRFYIDKLLIDLMEKNLFQLIDIRSRAIKSKVHPLYVNNKARLSNLESKRKCVPTMKSEIILVFQK